MTLALGIVLAASCQPGSKSGVPRENPAKLAEELNDEVSLKQDREKFSQLRKDIPDRQRLGNDELAMDLELMTQANEKPYRIRSRFQKKVSKIRSVFRRQSQRIRTKFRDTQKRQRDEFLTQLKKEREDFKRKAPQKSKTKEFYAEQDLRRKDFFAEQKDQRKEFDSTMREKSKDFNGNMRERIRQFEEQLRLYTKNYNAKEREEKMKRQEARRQGIDPKGPYFRSDPQVEAKTRRLMKEFDEMEKKASQPLETD